MNVHFVITLTAHAAKGNIYAEKDLIIGTGIIHTVHQPSNTKLG